MRKRLRWFLCLALFCVGAGAACAAVPLKRPASAPPNVTPRPTLFKIPRTTPGSKWEDPRKQELEKIALTLSPSRVAPGGMIVLEARPLDAAARRAMRTTGQVGVVYRNEVGHEGKLDLRLEDDGVYRGTLTFENDSFHDFTFQARFSYGLNPTLVSAPRRFRLAVAPERVRLLRFENGAASFSLDRPFRRFSTSVSCETHQGGWYRIPAPLLSFSIDDPAVAAATTFEASGVRLDEAFENKVQTVFRAAFEGHEASADLYVNQRSPSGVVANVEHILPDSAFESPERPQTEDLFISILGELLRVVIAERLSADQPADRPLPSRRVIEERRRPEVRTDAFDLRVASRANLTGEPLLFEAALPAGETRWGKAVLTLTSFDHPLSVRYFDLMPRLRDPNHNPVLMQPDEDGKYRAAFVPDVGGVYEFCATALGTEQAYGDVRAYSRKIRVEVRNDRAAILKLRLVEEQRGTEEGPLLLHAPGETKRLFVEMYTPRARWTPFRGEKADWFADDTSVATVAEGRLTARGSGLTAVVASFGDLAAGREVRVGKAAEEWERQQARFSQNRLLPLSPFPPMELHLSASTERAKPGDTVRFVAEAEQPFESKKLSAPMFALKGYRDGLLECTVWMRLSEDGKFRGSLTFMEEDDGLFLFSPNPLTRLEEPINATTFHSNSLWVRVSPDGSTPPPAEEPQRVGGPKILHLENSTLFTISASADKKPPKETGP